MQGHPRDPTPNAAEEGHEEGVEDSAGAQYSPGQVCLESLGSIQSVQEDTMSESDNPPRRTILIEEPSNSSIGQVGNMGRRVVFSESPRAQGPGGQGQAMAEILGLSGAFAEAGRRGPSLITKGSPMSTSCYTNCSCLYCSLSAPASALVSLAEEPGLDTCHQLWLYCPYSCLSRALLPGVLLAVAFWVGPCFLPPFLPLCAWALGPWLSAGCWPGPWPRLSACCWRSGLRCLDYGVLLPSLLL
jgi:hypothetical protein